MRRNKTEIGSGNAPGDDGASPCLNTDTKVPHVANFGQGANGTLITGRKLPLAPIPSGGQSVIVNQRHHAASETGAMDLMNTTGRLPPSQTIAYLADLQKTRIFCIKRQSHSDRSCDAFIARTLGYTSPREKDTERSGEKERKALFARSAAIRRGIEKEMIEIEKGGQMASDSQTASAPEADGEIISVCSPLVQASAHSRLAWDNLLVQTVKLMCKHAKSLPVYTWANSVKGFGDLGLAIIVAETGDLSNFATKERVWKRLGLAVIAGERQQRRTNAEEAKAHGYAPRRRAEIWTIADSLFKHQWHGAKKDRDAGPSGPYGQIYARRKAHTATRGWTPAHRDSDARRIMTKALIEDLWRVWNDKEPLAIPAAPCRKI